MKLKIVDKHDNNFINEEHHGPISPRRNDNSYIKT